MLKWLNLKWLCFGIRTPDYIIYIVCCPGFAWHDNNWEDIWHVFRMVLHKSGTAGVWIHNNLLSGLLVRLRPQFPPFAHWVNTILNTCMCLLFIESMIFASCKVLLLISSGIRVTKHTALPTFSSYVTSHLQQGPADIVWQRVIDESARHYLELFPDISSSEEYQ